VSDRHHLQLITDRRAAKRGLLEAVEVALDGGVDTLQVREKGAAAADVFASVLELERAARAHDVRILVNDRVDVVLATRAHGVHLAARGLPPAIARGLLEPWQLLGVSVHSVEEARAAAAAGADYVTFGHVYPTWSHEDEPPRGPRMLEDVVDAVDVPVLAIGGITFERVDEVLATGCAGIAVISAVLGADEPRAATSRLRDALDASTATPRRAFPARRGRTSFARRRD